MPNKKMRKDVREPERKPAAALYVRVSTDRQAEEGYSIEVQKERLAAFTKTMDGPVSYEFYVDDGFSGASLERPAMQSLIRDAKNRALTHVCVYKLDRLSRSQKDTLFLIEDIFLPNDVAFISLQESFNTSTAFGRAVVGILSVFAQLERENIYERTRGGMQKRVEAGFWPGGGGVPYGYDYDIERGILVPNGDAETVRQLYDLYIRGYSLQNIANMLDLKYEKLASQILTRKTNIGIIEYNGVEYRGRHEPIVSAEIFEKAMALRAARSERRLVSSGRHLLTGLVRCGVCGAGMRYQKWGGRGQKIVCYSQQISKPYLVRDPECSNESVWAKDIEERVIEDVFSITAKEIPADGDAAARASVGETLERKRAALEVKLKRLYELYASQGNAVLLDTINDLNAEAAKLQEKIQQEKEKGTLSKNALAARERIRSVEHGWAHMDAQEKRSLICSVVDGITVTHGAVAIEYRC